MNKAEIDAERMNFLLRTFGQVSVGTQIKFLRWMDDREVVLVAALEAVQVVLGRCQDVWLGGAEDHGLEDDLSTCRNQIAKLLRLDEPETDVIEF